MQKLELQQQHRRFFLTTIIKIKTRQFLNIHALAK